MEDITKIVKSSKHYGLWIRLWIKSVTKTNEILKKKKKSGCLCMLSGGDQRDDQNRWWDYPKWWWSNLNKTGFLLSPYPLTNFEIQIYY